MELFAGTIDALRILVEAAACRRSWPADEKVQWPCGGGRNIVFKEDMALELGSPETESVSCLLWTEDISCIDPGTVTMIGPDFTESHGRSLPFGKVVLLAVEGFSEDNAYERHRDLDLLRYDLDLKGFMIRAVSQHMREWCRISRDALAQGLSAHVLGSSIIRLYRKTPYVKGVEIIFFTSSVHDVRRLGEITAPSGLIVAAMNKMASEMDFECSSCDYRAVCGEAEGLKGMRDRLMDRSRRSVHG
ncbi:MAG TPA: hypothetical protein PLT09_08050 [Deltaproteobacteria bacterium]|nr:hypothetical protein [Deltaproteobacteria bacterium]HPR54539.1 hypothetical protein [Deltaproteobacteria bacterium]HXK47381.1 hypothetical protein [Deltaproteobacteria bacterium]